MFELTAETKERVRAVFSPDDWHDVEDILLRRCGENLLTKYRTEHDENLIERIRFAVLKVSNGSMSLLEQAVLKANSDWRDILWQSGFVKSTTEHLTWKP